MADVLARTLVEVILAETSVIGPEPERPHDVVATHPALPREVGHHVHPIFGRSDVGAVDVVGVRLGPRIALGVCHPEGDALDGIDCLEIRELAEPETLRRRGVVPREASFRLLPRLRSSAGVDVRIGRGGIVDFEASDLADGLMALVADPR